MSLDDDAYWARAFDSCSFSSSAVTLVSFICSSVGGSICGTRAQPHSLCFGSFGVVLVRTIWSNARRYWNNRTRYP